jgi:hypothetical protein
VLSVYERSIGGRIQQHPRLTTRYSAAFKADVHSAEGLLSYDRSASFPRFCHTKAVMKLRHRVEAYLIVVKICS